jgi:hypothetical protein
LLNLRLQKHEGRRSFKALYHYGDRQAQRCTAIIHDGVQLQTGQNVAIKEPQDGGAWQLILAKVSQ